jgi:hypothetical protein
MSRPTRFGTLDKRELFGQYWLGNSREEKMAKPSRWTAEKRYQIVKEALSQKEPIGQIARRHQVSEALIYRWREKFFEGGKAALAFEGRQGSGGERWHWSARSKSFRS